MEGVARKRRKTSDSSEEKISSTSAVPDSTVQADHATGDVTQPSSAVVVKPVAVPAQIKPSQQPSSSSSSSESQPKPSEVESAKCAASGDQQQPVASTSTEKPDSTNGKAAAKKAEREAAPAKAKRLVLPKEKPTMLDSVAKNIEHIFSLLNPSTK